jgi:hypothetical protein
MSESSDTRDVSFSPRERRQCQQCGAYCHNDDTACWFCKREFSQPTVPPLRPGQFSLLALIGAMTAAAVGMGIFLFSPVLAIVIAAFLIAALIRLAVVESRVTTTSNRSYPAPFLWRFFVSLMLVFLAAIATTVAFVVGCFAAAMLSVNSRPIPDVPLWPIGLGFVVGLVLAGAVLWATRHVTMAD